MTAPALAALLDGYRFYFASERDLQAGIAQVWARAGVPFAREYRLSAGDILDFWIPPGIAVEVKVDGSLSALTRQIHRYAGHPAVTAILVVTSLSRLLRLPETLQGVRVYGKVLRDL